VKKDDSEEILFEKNDLQIFGEHNLQNALAAAAAAYLFGVKSEIIKAGISYYSGIRHRLKLIYNIGGIGYFDDTQATTPEATIAGISAFSENVVLLAGGDDKGMDYERLGGIINEKVKAIILFPGTASLLIEKTIDKNKVIFDKAENFQEAISILKKYIGDKTISSGGAVLISPASAHFYSRFVESSGKDLKEWVKEVKK
jgi:UDP-N-acetylmuramoylalanine--D-glutamate ligase